MLKLLDNERRNTTLIGRDNVCMLRGSAIGFQCSNIVVPSPLIELSPRAGGVVHQKLTRSQKEHAAPLHDVKNIVNSVMYCLMHCSCGGI